MQDEKTGALAPVFQSSSFLMPNILRSIPHKYRGLFQITTFIEVPSLTCEQYDTESNQTSAAQQNKKRSWNEPAEYQTDGQPKAELSE